MREVDDEEPLWETGGPGDERSAIEKGAVVDEETLEVPGKLDSEGPAIEPEGLTDEEGPLILPLRKAGASEL